MRTRKPSLESLEGRTLLTATFIDIDYSPELSTASENAFVTTIQREDGVYETYLTGSEGSDNALVATSETDRLLDGLVGQAFGPDVANKGNDFAFARDIGDKVQLWSGEQRNNDLKYHQRNRFDVPGEFVDLDFAPKASTETYNAFYLTVNDGGTFKTYQYNTENNTANHKSLVAQGGLLNDLVGQAFGPDVENKGNDFAFARDIGSKVQIWSGEQKDGELEYFNRNRFEVKGEFVDLDFAFEASTDSYNAFYLTVNDGGTFKTYQYNTENNTTNHKALIAQGGLLNGVVGQAFGPDVENKGNDFRYVRLLENGTLQFWIGEQKDNDGDGDVDLKYHQRGKFEFKS